MADRRLERPWHGASDRAEEPAVAAIRLQRAEVEALLAFRHAAEGDAPVLAWWRVQQVRRQRRAVQADATLPPLPGPPPGAFGWWGRLLLRLGRLDLEGATPPRAIARQLRAS